MKSAARLRFAKLTETIVRVIKSRLRAGDLPKNLAADYGVHIETIYKISRKQTWYWVKPEEPTRQGAFVSGAAEPGASVSA